MAPFDPWDQAALTHLIKRKLTYGRENSDDLSAKIAPVENVKSRRVKFKVISPDAFGVGGLRAPDAVPLLTRSSFSRQEEIIDLALPDEMERISEDIQQKLASTDENIRDAGGLDMVTRGAILAERSRRAVIKMRWEAYLTGKVTTHYDDSGTAVQINFGYANEQLPNAAVPWTDTVTSDPIEELRAWQKQLANAIGFFGTKIHMSTNTFELLRRNEKILQYIVANNNSDYRIVTQKHIEDLLYAGTEIIIYDGGYREIGSDKNSDGTSKGISAYGYSSLTPWLPDGKVMITTDYQIDGEKIADTPTGLVAVQTGYNEVQWRQGLQSEQMLHPISKNLFLRVGNAAIPRLRIPEAFLVATVADPEDME